MSKQQPPLQSTARSNSRERLSNRIVSILLIFCLLAVSTPAAPAHIVGTANETWRGIRFSILTSHLAIDAPNWFATIFAGAANVDRVTKPISRIRIFPGSLDLKKGQEAVLSAVAYDDRNEPISGVAFQWSTFDAGRSRSARFFANSRFTARQVGTYLVRATAGGRQAEAPVVVTSPEHPMPPNLPTRTISSRSLPGTVETLGGGESKDEKGPSEPSMLLPGEGWDDTNWPSSDDPGNLPSLINGAGPHIGDLAFGGRGSIGSGYKFISFPSFGIRIFSLSVKRP